MQETKKTDQIFIVDDDKMTSSIYEQHLLNLGYENIKSFESGQDCINQLILEPQVIFLDYQMDYLNGLEVLKKIKRFNPEIYVVVVSAQEDMETAINSMKYGAFDYIIKGQSDLDRMKEVLLRINNVREQLNKREPGFFRKVLSLMV